MHAGPSKAVWWRVNTSTQPSVPGSRTTSSRSGGDAVSGGATASARVRARSSAPGSGGGKESGSTSAAPVSSHS
ncbi:hypothetical protein SCALM49S_08436 [Streptomyces californicus]